MHKNGNMLYEIVMTVKGLLDLKSVISVLNCKDRTFQVLWTWIRQFRLLHPTSRN